MPSGEPSLSQPARGISPGDAIQRFFKKYATFQGRASRSEFWWIFLFAWVIEVVLGSLSKQSNIFTVLYAIVALAIVVPYLAVGARRLHDTGRSGWWWLIGLIPCIGFIVLVVFWAQDAKPEGDRYNVA